ncbi:DNA methyltransferase [Gordonia phthalatica]|uniref:Methyltransferase n=1 Tax=Gordonia phthalatica TaxID=1136941 RepID=A0A0N9N2J1_9ACTN|nr:DNA methyltransferase [Gordonia phthalatica]ALG84440.1 methyltransferase [Gordonia phthalatica]
MTSPSEGAAAPLAVRSPLAEQLIAAHDDFLRQRPPSADEDVHMLGGIVDHVIDRCTEPGDAVFDPFAGFGTTLLRAGALGRRAYGVELLPERVAALRAQMPNARIHEGDARAMVRVLRAAGEPADSCASLVLTSPPYMTSDDHDADPLTAYEETGADYPRYLRELGLVAAQCAHVVVPGGYVVWNVADIHHLGRTTHLIADCRRVLGEHLAEVGTTDIVWDRYPHDLVADALLVFRKA